uniref:Ig-like domain-containing protein n=1 Tax=Cyprinodon variegatus TaxID=28743 RepID=A0A3Q2GN14_CYPVA
MTLLWITVFILHQGFPVVTVQLGEPVTFTCAAMEKFTSRTWIHWYKQNSGDTLTIIAMQRNKVDHTSSPEFPSSRFKATNDDKISNLTILRTVEKDEGMYHCAIFDWTESTWMGTYLTVKGKCETSVFYIVVQQSTVSQFSRPEDSETLQCSVLSESENNSCSEDLSMFWFKAGSNRPYPNIIYTDSKRADNCEKSPNTRTKCTYNFPKNISSSDPGTYYCAVATCGEILLGNVIIEDGGIIHILRNMHNNK